jgi:hypothetical protein
VYQQPSGLADPEATQTTPLNAPADSLTRYPREAEPTCEAGDRTLLARLARRAFRNWIGSRRGFLNGLGSFQLAGQCNNRGSNPGLLQQFVGLHLPSSEGWNKTFTVLRTISYNLRTGKRESTA